MSNLVLAILGLLIAAIIAVYSSLCCEDIEDVDMGHHHYHLHDKGDHHEN